MRNREKRRKSDWKDVAIAQDIKELEKHGFKRVKPGNVIRSGQMPNRIKLLRDAADSLEQWLHNGYDLMKQRDIDNHKLQIHEIRRTATDLEIFAKAFQLLL